MLQKNFKDIKGIIIGRTQLGAKLPVEDFAKLLGEKEELKNVPIIINMDFGHTRPLFTIPIGSDCIIDNDQITIVQE